MDSFKTLALFVRIAEVHALGAAGREFGLSPASVSERLAALEAHYGARLINRTTRAISLTDEGRLLLVGAKNLLSDAADLEARIGQGVDQVSGPIRMTASFDLGRNRIAPLLDAFMKKYPGVELDLILTDGFSDLISEGIDVALRFGDLKDSSLHARKIGEHTRVVCASPKYLKRHGVPQHPADLAQHNCLLMRFGNSIDREWKFIDNRRRVTHVVRGNRITNDGEVVRRWCLAGHGIALKSNWDVDADLKAGRLVQVLGKFAPPPSSIQIIFPSNHAMPKRIRTLIDFLAAAFAE